LSRLLRLLLERMEHENCVPNRRQIDHSESARFLAYPYLPHPLPDRFERLSISRIIAFLDLAKLESRLGTRVVWKVANADQAVTEEGYRLHGKSMYQNRYTNTSH
jgi:hypothetical protein